MKINEVDKVTTLAPVECITAIAADGSLIQIPVSELGKVMAQVMPVATSGMNGLLNRNRWALYDYYTTFPIYYRSLKFKTDINRLKFATCILDIKDIVSWNFIGFVSLRIKINYSTLDSSLKELSVANISSPGIIKSVFAYYESDGYLAFSVNFGSLNISGGYIMAACFANRSDIKNLGNSIKSVAEGPEYITGTNESEVFVRLDI